MINKNRLALYGGNKEIKKLPNRFLYTNDEKREINLLINHSIKTGIPFRYAEKYEEKYTKLFTKFMGGGYADAVNSGTNALFSIIGALDIPPGSEIIVPIMTDVGGVSPIIFWGCKPIICDVATNSFNVSLNEIKRKITNKTRAVIVVHIGGEPVNILPIKKFLKKRNIYLIEDCSQSHGAKIGNSRIGTFGDISFFSTMSSKLHSSGGQGGLIYSRKKKFIDLVKSISDRGKVFKSQNFSGKYNYLGINSNLDELSAAIGSVQIKKLKGIIKKTHKLGEYMKQNLINKSKLMKVAVQIPNSSCVYWFIRIHLDVNNISVSKKNFCKALIAEGVPMAERYDYNPFKYKWYTSNKVKSLLRNHKLSIDRNINQKNYQNSMKSNFVIFIRESFSKSDIDLIIKALLKVERVLIK